MSSFQFLVTVIAGLALLCWAFPPKTPQSHTQAAFDQWATGCKPDDFHYGVTEDERGTRAFIVTCSPGGGK